jgi:hypothetical protein
VDARHKAGHDEFRYKLLPQARDPRKDQEAPGKRKGGSAMLPPQDSLPNRYQAFENNWSTYSQFTR